MHRVPIHINLEGNDRANQLANEATSNIQPSCWQFHIQSTWIDVFRLHMSIGIRRPLYLDIITLPTDIQLGRLRFWTYKRNFTGPSPATICRHCQQVYEPLHYLLNCPAYPKHRTILKGHLRAEYYQHPDHHLAALLTRKLTFLPDIITPLLQKDPYTYQGQITPPLWTSGWEHETSVPMVHVGREAEGSYPRRDIIVGVFSPTRQLVRFFLPQTSHL